MSRHYPLIGLSLAAAMSLSACATYSGSGAPAARADIRNAWGSVIGEALAYQRGSDIEIKVGVSQLAAGTYGTHIHMVGQCDAPKFTTAGAHWNPMGRQHGLESSMGPHGGDLPNLVVGGNGAGSISFRIPAQSVTGPGGIIDTDGGAIVVHAGPDDMKTDPSGNSGDRIACGVFRQV